LAADEDTLRTILNGDYLSGELTQDFLGHVMSMSDSLDELVVEKPLETLAIIVDSLNVFDDDLVDVPEDVQPHQFFNGVNSGASPMPKRIEGLFNDLDAGVKASMDSVQASVESFNESVNQVSSASFGLLDPILSSLSLLSSTGHETPLTDSPVLEAHEESSEEESAAA
jgi:hypothetical protein